jgi:uncharacterized protein (TIGR00255 family)
MPISVYYRENSESRMTLSMTAFARRGADTVAGSLVWELRSVNHRYLDIAVRLPEDLRAIEGAAREAIGARLERGKVDATLKFQPVETLTGATVDDAAARQLLSAAHDVERLAPGLRPLSISDVLRWPGVLKAAGVDSDQLARAALDLLNVALDDMRETRAREGARLRELIEERLRAVRDIVSGISTWLPDVTKDYRVRLESRLAEIRGQLDPARLEQEMVLYATRADVTEEVDRLQTHVTEVGRVLSGKGQVGRRLDFLMQELNREANTLASKSVDIRLTNAAVELKVLIEQMREQVQNIE